MALRVYKEGSKIIYSDDTLNYPAEFRLVSDASGTFKVNGCYSQIFKRQL